MGSAVERARSGFPLDDADDAFQIALIPHTLEVTSFSDASDGDAVNLEVDILAKYVERLLEEAYAENNVDWLIEAIERLLLMGEDGYPLLRKVLVSFGNISVLENTLPAALREVFSGTAPGDGAP